MEKIELFKKYNINLSEEKYEKFMTYFNELILFNNQFNLTAITEENDVFIKHFLDSLYPEFLIKKNSKIIDIGAGAGFPSLPLKIYREDLSVTMIDSLNKRINFLNTMISKLKLENVESIHTRAEDFAKLNRNKFDYVVVRAVAKLSTLLEYSLPLLNVGGKLLAYKGDNIEDELASSNNALFILGGKIQDVLKYEIEGNKRTIIVVEKIKDTPTKYPRNKNLPKKNPL